MNWLNVYWQRFNQMERRERAALIALALFLGLLILYFGIWSPVQSYYQTSLQQRDEQMGLLRHMQGSEARAKAAAADTRPRTGGQSLISEVAGVSRQIGINPDRLQPEGSDAVSVWFENVAYMKLMNWILQLEQNHSISVRQIAIDRQNQSGMVSVRVVLRI